ncbi:thermonuclease family protein [Bradyrhizobium genosp. L]|uniref:thermonuclease family protein n=1 Tax=Bradyrhizobium genosp. L TaxID=83637 RepID=UPI0018A2A575|nr:thermonuclease family protein [Bradyrhizobium genosp. L]QPF82326.1 thermonuclease family protein [Bradyrhizobium genosp. L]
MRFRNLVVTTLLLTCLSATPGVAAPAVVKDAGTVQLGNTTYRLDGIDAPAIDQLCTDEHADVWSCGVEARDQLVKLIGGKPIHCDDIGGDPSFKKRRLGVCKIEGDPTSLSQLLVQQGYALNAEASATGRFKPDEATAKDNRAGLWRGCFVAPHDFRHGTKDGALLGNSCPAERDTQIRAALFPDAPPMPATCNIKGKYAVRARVTGNIGIYHLQACRSYPGLSQDRWFCSEEDAQAAGFRRAYNCRPSKSK